MLDAYHNMSVPPQSKIRWDIRLPDVEHLAFSLSTPGLPWSSTDDARFWADAHADDIAAAGRLAPRGFFAVPTLSNDAPLPSGCRLCHDPALVAAVLGRIAGGLYIPLRQPRLLVEHYASFFLFPCSAFPTETSHD